MKSKTKVERHLSHQPKWQRECKERKNKKHSPKWFKGKSCSYCGRTGDLMSAEDALYRGYFD